MAKNLKLNKARKAKNDEFYTQYDDIADEINAYLLHNPDMLRGKIVMCPCDDYHKSNFTQYFIDNFEKFGLKELISTCYEGFVLRYCGNRCHTACGTSHEYSKLSNGDFRSPEVTKLRDEADFIFTNPPFSLFREFIKWLMESGKQFSVLGNMNGVKYKEVYPYIANNKMWLGSTGRVQPIFEVPKRYEDICTTFEINGTLYSKGPACAWYTNIEHGRCRDKLSLMTLKDNINFNKRLIKHCKGNFYPQYDNVKNVIEVPFVNAIPSNYEGFMAVPVTYLEKHNPEQFEIIDLMNCIFATDFFNLNKYLKANKLSANTINGKVVYARLIIRKIKK